MDQNTESELRREGDTEDLLCPASAGPPNPEEDDGNHDQEGQTNGLKEVVNKLIPVSIRKDIEKACQSIHDVFVRKVKMLKKPRFKLGKLMELHGEGCSSGKATEDEVGAKAERADGYEPPVQESV
ncbi:40S ribosomal protein S3a [Tupaia chinensis]|uniref:40S ribosomal protein S3a n=1 Tax=Tupaia chinensis TaxID=246437 RepID=L9JFL6_TUPCH|nr:40S ribosomal protein S3a [Tupaia chinensis]